MYRWITRWRSSFFFQAGVFFFLVVPVFFIRIDGRGYQLDAESMSSAAGFSQWKVGFAREAIKKGIKPEILARVFDGVVLNERVIKADRYQPEFSKSAGDYFEIVVSRKRVREGQRLLKKGKQDFASIEQKYHVPASVFIAIWGAESFYGHVYGDYDVIEALATLAYTGRRMSWARTQLFSVLRSIQTGRIKSERVVGSWAGAMGHTQFIPTTFESFAVDFTGDGHVDFWSEDALDALASAANYLLKSGWRYGEAWGIEVLLPEKIDYGMLHEQFVRSVSFWAQQGVVAADGRQLPLNIKKASVIVPSGSQGPAFMVLPNFHVIKKYNNATLYALAVGHLSDRLSGKAALIASWPKEKKPLTSHEVQEIQSLLLSLGYNPGGIDGIAGARTKFAIRNYQKSKRQIEDGYPSRLLLSLLRKEIKEG
jgi:lytic murein transglycosylase